MRSHLISRKIKNNGSALILAVVLTVLLSVIGITFLMVSRVDEAVTSNISDEKSLEAAAKSIVDIISEELVKDVPGVAGQEYYDYPGDNDPWLACIEPTVVGATTDKNSCYWLQISDVTGYLKENKILTKYVNINPPGAREVMQDYSEIDLDDDGQLRESKKGTNNNNDPIPNSDLPEGLEDLYEGQLADADGDGIADSKWIELNLTKEKSGTEYDTALGNAKGTPIYAAIRVIDNCGMVNVNTALAFDHETEINKLVDGSMLSQVDLAGLIGRADADKTKALREIIKDDTDAVYKLNYLLKGKDNVATNYDIKGRFTDSDFDFIGTSKDWWPTHYVTDLEFDIEDLESYYAWRYPEGVDTTERLDNQYRFGIDDEIALRERFCINTPGMTGLQALWPWRDSSDDVINPMDNPYDGSTNEGLSDFIDRIVDDERITDPITDSKFEKAHKKHWLTTYSYDRIIDPDGHKQFCINIDPTTDAKLLDDVSSYFMNENESKDTAKRLYYTFIKAACLDKGYSSRRELKIEELRKLAQLAVNIVDLRDLDSDPTCIDINVENSPFGSEYAYLNPEVWTKGAEDDEIIETFEKPDAGYSRYCYGLEMSPVISGVAVAYEKFQPSNASVPTDPTDPIIDWTVEGPTAHYAIEIYNPYDVDIQMRQINEYRLAIWSKTRGTIVHRLNLDSRKGILELPSRGFLVICDDAGFWNSYINSVRIRNDEYKVVVIQDGGLSLSRGLEEVYRDEGIDVTIPIDNRIRIPERIFLQKRVRSLYGGFRYLALDRFDPDNSLVHWDPYSLDTEVSMKQRYTMDEWQKEPDDGERSFSEENVQWWDCLYPDTVAAWDNNNVKLGFERDPNSIVRNFKVDFSVPMQNYFKTRYYKPPVDEYTTAKSQESWEKDGQDGDDFWPILDFATVGDISRIWTVGPKDWQTVDDILGKIDMSYRTYLNETFSENYDYSTYDSSEVNNFYFSDPNDPNMFLDTCTVGDYMHLVNRGNREDLFRLNLRDPRFSNIFQYVTVFDPSSDYIDNDGDQIEDEDPIEDGIDNDGDEDKDEDDERYYYPGTEMKIPGRINVNTAPWYVIAQLPWAKVNKDADMPDFDEEERYDLARAIVAYRDKLAIKNGPDYSDGASDIPGSDPDESDSRWAMIKDVIKKDIEDDPKEEDVREERGFASIGELGLVVNDTSSLANYSIDKLGINGDDIKGFPDLVRNSRKNSGDKKGDDAEDDFEEKDLIFSRMSNLTTVRSDTFTAYILVRLGANGPQKRYIAILDRSDVYPRFNSNGTRYEEDRAASKPGKNVVGKVKIVALHEVTEIR